MIHNITIQSIGFKSNILPKSKQSNYKKKGWYFLIYKKCKRNAVHG
eukprot:UN02394